MRKKKKSKKTEKKGQRLTKRDI